MRYRVQYAVITTKVVGGKPVKEIKTSGRMVDLGEGMAETARSQKVHKAIRDVLQVTHAKNQGMEESAVKIMLNGVRRMAKSKPSEVIHDFWIAEPESIVETLPADKNATIKGGNEDEEDKDDTPTDDKDNQENASADLEDEEDDWDDDEEDEPPKPTVNVKPPPQPKPDRRSSKLTTKKKK